MPFTIAQTVTFEEEIKKLISIQKINQTINYVEFPGIDSLKLGRREADVLGDIHIPHVYYFSSYVLENLMGRYGFKKLYLETIKRIDSDKVYSPCTAGGRLVEIFPDGVVRGCEVEKLWDISKIGAVNENDLDIFLSVYFQPFGDRDLFISSGDMSIT